MTTVQPTNEVDQELERGEALDSAVAIIGVAGRFPGADDVATFFSNLCHGVESIRPLTVEELRDAGVSEDELADPAYVRAGAPLSDVEHFDAAFFGYTPREAQLVDPQQRIFLECAWQALEDAGHAPSQFGGSIGVFGGASSNTYLLSNVLRRPDILASAGTYQLLLASDKDYLATRVSYKLNLTGPSLTIQTACSSSLVAVHVAIGSLLSGECDLALAGGASIGVPHHAGYTYAQGGILSPDGHCRAFDAGAAGTVGGNGVAVVVLRRLRDAIERGDSIVAVLRGTAINNDGANKVGFTAPSVRGQTRVIRDALAVAGVEAASIGYVECHGTGTKLGDPTEIDALSAAFVGAKLPRESCAIGSVKTNVGHLDAAAGVTGLIKAALVVKSGTLPKTLHFSTPNPQIRFSETPFRVQAETASWSRSGVRRAGVSAFGIGGTNAHAIVEEPPSAAPTRARHDHHLLTLSARTPTALSAARERLAAHLATRSAVELADVAHTLQRGREPFAHRFTCVAASIDEARAALSSASILASSVRAAPSVVFLFPGQGSQYSGLARGLYESYPVFRESWSACASRVLDATGFDLRGWIEGRSELDIASTEVTQPLLFVAEVSVARLWASLGVTPAAMVGHSIGELVAAHLAGVFSLDDALSIVCARGRLMAAAPRGAMLSLSLPESDARQRLEPGLEIAVVNGTKSVVVGGDSHAVDRFEEKLRAEGVASSRLRTSHAFHTRSMDSALAGFEAAVASAARGAPSVPFVSNVTGTWITEAEARSPAYWAKQLRSCVRFAQGIDAAMTLHDPLFLEVGPGRTLAQLVGAQTAAMPSDRRPAIVSTLRHPREDVSDERTFLQAVGKVWSHGVSVKWEALHDGEWLRRIPLPTYPFERTRCWIDGPGGSLEATLRGSNAGPSPTPTAQSKTDSATSLERRADPTREPAWTAQEKGLAAIWEDLLGIPGLSPADDFFEVGGHSLLATQMLTRVRVELGVELPLAAVFECRTLHALAARIASTRAEEGAMRSARPPLRKRAVASDASSLPSREVDLSHAQQRMWLLDRMDPGSPLYNVTGAVEVRGRLDFQALQRSVDDLVARHETLRSVFPPVDGKPTCFVLAAPSVAIERTVVGDSEEGAKVEEILRDESRRSFDLATGPLLRLRLIERATDEAVLVLTMHHIISDGWSIGVLVQELGALYLAHAEHRAPNLPPLPIQYQDYASWQRTWLAGGELARQLEYWKPKLAGEIPLLELPGCATRRVDEAPANTLHRQLPADLTAAVKAACSKRGVTPFMWLLSAYQVVLHRYTGHADIAVGSPVAGRVETDLEPLIGFFVNTLVLRTQVDADLPFASLLERTKATALEAFAHQDVPFDRLVEELQPQRDPTRTPFFQTMFALQNLPASTISLPGVELAMREVDVAAALFDWSLVLREEEIGGCPILTAALEYNSALFEESTVARLWEHYVACIRSALTEDSTPVGRLELSSPEERAALTGQLAGDDPESAGITGRVPSFLEELRRQAEIRPDAVAVVAADDLGNPLTYGALFARAKKLAAHLASMSVGPGARVALYSERRCHAIVGILGTLLAGAAYVPIDTKNPRERIAAILESAAPVVTLTQASLARDLPPAAGKLFRLDADFGVVLERVDDRGKVDPPADAAAYVIYTSGTTGAPKGVVVSRRALSHYAWTMADRLELRAGERLLQFASFGFDASVEEIFCTLAVGATLVLRGDDMLDTVERFAGRTRALGIDVLDLSTAFFHLLAAHATEADFSALGDVRLVVVGGEKLRSDRVRAFLERCAKGTRILNTYGPTECTVAATCVDVTDLDSRGDLPIGRPIPGVQVYVLDAAGGLAPRGVPGELYLGGVTLAEGYLGDASKTRDRFVDHPFSKVPGARLYRTGDVVRFRDDGNLVFLGRSDQQVKIRGFRVELREVESVLCEHPGVAEAAVVASADSTGVLRLAAYVVPREPTDFEATVLVPFVRARLPEYMVPASLAVVSKLPQNANGKVDVRALPAPTFHRSVGSAAFIGPRNPIEEVLATLYSELLGAANVSVRDDFFELGGHSLLATQLLSRLQTSLEVELTLRQLLSSPTVEQLAALVEEAMVAQLDAMTDQQAAALAAEEER